MRRRSRGLTLIELMVTIALAAVLVSLAAPSLTNFLAKRRVEGVASELVTDLQYARSEAVQRNAVVRLIVGASCYTIHVAGTTDATSCTSLGTGATSLKEVTLTSGIGLTFHSNNGKAFIEFDPVRGMAIDSTSAGNDTSGYIDVASTSSSGNWQLRALVTKVGRVQLCSPNASMSGITNCT